MLKRVVVIDELSEKYHFRGRIISYFMHGNSKADYTVLFNDGSIGYFDARRKDLINIY